MRLKQNKTNHSRPVYTNTCANLSNCVSYASLPSGFEPFVTSNFESALAYLHLHQHPLLTRLFVVPHVQYSTSCK